MKNLSLTVLSAALLLTACGGQPQKVESSVQSSEISTSEMVSVSEQDSREASSGDESEAEIASSEGSLESEVEISSSEEEVLESESESELESIDSIIESEEEQSVESSGELHNGTLEDPFTVSEGYDQAAELAANAYLEGQFFIKGVVTGEIVINYKRASFNITDGDRTLYVYNMQDSDNKAAYTADNLDFAAGDEIIVAGTIKNYVKDDVSTLEICYVKDVASCYKAG